MPTSQSGRASSGGSKSTAHEPVHVIPCGAPVAHFVPEPEPSGRMRFITIGRLQPQKGVHIAIEALARAGMALGGAELRVVGGGKRSAGELVALQSLAARLGVTDRVKAGQATPAEFLEAAWFPRRVSPCR